MTTGAIYGRFRNKADLLAAAISAKTAGELVSRSVSLGGKETDYVETLTRLASEYRRRRSLRSLIVQGAVAAGTDEETRTLLRDEQQTYLIQWFEQYEQNRDRMGIDPSVDMHSALLYTWAVEVGLGVLEAFGIEPRSAKAWADIHNRFARSLQLRPDAQDRRTPRRLRR